MQSVPDHVTVGQAYHAAGVKAFRCFGVSALTRYHLQIAAVFELQRRGISFYPGLGSKRKSLSEALE